MKSFFYKRLPILLMLSFFSITVFAQEKGVVIGGTDLEQSAILQLESDERGMLIPRMNTLQRNVIIAPVDGLMIYNTNNGIFNKYYNGEWRELDTDWSRKLNVPSTTLTSRHDIYHLDGNVAIGSDQTGIAQLYIKHNGFPSFLVDDENGDQLFHIGSNGNVGIRGLGNFVDFLITGKPSNINNYIFLAEDSDGNNDFLVRSDGRVAVGLQATSTRFTVRNQTGFNTSFLVEDSSGNDDFIVRSDGGVGVGEADQSTRSKVKNNTGVANSFLVEDSNGDDDFIVLSNGSVGVGHNSASLGTKFKVRNQEDKAFSFIVEDSAGDNDFAVRSDGSVGVGEASSGTKFKVRNQESKSASFLVEDAAGNNDFYISEKGNVGIGANSFSDTDLLVKGKASNNNLLICQDDDTGINVLRVQYNANQRGIFVDGVAGKPGGGEWGSTSDRRLKKDIIDYSEGLDFVKKIRPVWYTYNGKGGTPDGEKYVGIIAQELQEYAPHMVHEMQADEKDGIKYLSVNTSAMKYMLINAVQEQQDQIEALQKMNNELLRRLEALEKK